MKAILAIWVMFIWVMLPLLAQQPAAPPAPTLPAAPATTTSAPATTPRGDPGRGTSDARANRPGCCGYDTREAHRARRRSRHQRYSLARPIHRTGAERLGRPRLPLGLRRRRQLGHYRSIINLGSGPKFLGTDFTLADPKHRWF